MPHRNTDRPGLTLTPEEVKLLDLIRRRALEVRGSVAYQKLEDEMWRNSHTTQPIWQLKDKGLVVNDDFGYWIPSPLVDKLIDEGVLE